MTQAATMEEFQTLLNSENLNNPLLSALRALMSLEEPQEVVVAALVHPRAGWGWT